MRRLTRDFTVRLGMCGIIRSWLISSFIFTKVIDNVPVIKSHGHRGDMIRSKKQYNWSFILTWPGDLLFLHVYRL